MAGNIHPTAIVAPDAELAEGVEVGAYAVIGPGVQVGANTRIGPHVVIQGPTRLGADNQLFPFASIGSAPQDKKYRDEPTRLEIGDRNVIRECVTLNRGTVQDHGITRIGDDNLFMAYAHVAHDCVIGNHCILATTPRSAVTCTSVTGRSWAACPGSTSSAGSVPTRSSRTTRRSRATCRRT